MCSKIAVVNVLTNILNKTMIIISRLTPPNKKKKKQKSAYNGCISINRNCKNMA